VILVSAGRVQKTHGVHGYLKCAYTTDNPELLKEREAYLLHDPRTQECLPVTPVDIKLQPDCFLIRFAEFSAPEPLKRFSTWELVYPSRRGQLPRERDEIYYFELVDMEVRRPDGAVIGHVAEVRHSGAHVLLELDTASAKLVPFIREFIPEVNLEQGWLVCTYPLESNEVLP
jgi:16S rRNA processing protein RimM